MEKMKSHNHNHEGLSSLNGPYRDPVCGMSTAKEDDFLKYNYEGNTFHFCSVSCLEKFKKEPEKYTSKDTDKKLPPTPMLRKTGLESTPAQCILK